MRELTAYEIEEVNGGFSISICIAIAGMLATLCDIYYGGSGSGSASASTSGGSTSASVPPGSGCTASSEIGSDGSQSSTVSCPKE